MAALVGEPVGALLVDHRDPVDGLHVVDQGRPVEEPPLGNEGRPVAGLAGLALQGLDQRRLLTADIGAGTATQDHEVRRDQARGDQLIDGLAQHPMQAGILVAQVDIERAGLHRPGADQGPLQEAVRLALQVMAVLEGAGFALVGVDHRIARAGLGAHRLPLAIGGKPRPAEAPQPRTLELIDQRLDTHLTVATCPQQAVAAGAAVVGQALPEDRLGMEVAGVHHRLDPLRGGVEHVVMAYLRHRGGVAAPHAGGAHHPHRLGGEAGREPFAQGLGAGQLAGERIADPHRDLRRRRLVVVDHVEVGIEGGRLVDRRHGQRHVGGQRPQFRQGEVAMSILKDMEVLDQPVPQSQARVGALVAQQHAQGRQRHRRQVASARLAAEGTLGVDGRFCHGGLVVMLVRWRDIDGLQPLGGDDGHHRHGVTRPRSGQWPGTRPVSEWRRGCRSQHVSPSAVSCMTA